MPRRLLLDAGGLLIFFYGAGRRVGQSVGGCIRAYDNPIPHMICTGEREFTPHDTTLRLVPWWCSPRGCAASGTLPRGQPASSVEVRHVCVYVNIVRRRPMVGYQHVVVTSTFSTPHNSPHTHKHTRTCSGRSKPMDRPAPPVPFWSAASATPVEAWKSRIASRTSSWVTCGTVCGICGVGGSGGMKGWVPCHTYPGQE